MLHDPTVLNEVAVPEHELVVHREDKISRLSRSLRASTSGDLTYLLGPPGTGKTMCAKLKTDNWGGVSGSDSVYINCWQTYERNDILYKVVDELCNDVAIHRSSTPRGTVVNHLTDEPEDRRFVILDEADQLHDKAILYDLIEAPKLHLVLIANAEDDLFNGIDERLQSRLTIGKRIDFEQYTARQLSAILAKRAEFAFQKSSAVDGRQLDTIAEHADGDARESIRALREAADLAVERGHEEIEDADVERAIPRAKEALRQKKIDQLNEHQRTIYDIVVEQGPISPDTLYEVYSGRIPDPNVKRTIRTYTSKLVHYTLIESHGDTQNRTYTAIQ